MVDNHSVPQDGLVRLSSIIGPVRKVIPVSKSTWWAGIKSGRFPKPVKLGPRTTAWRDADIRALIESGIVAVFLTCMIDSWFRSEHMFTFQATTDQIIVVTQAIETKGQPIHSGVAT